MNWPGAVPRWPNASSRSPLGPNFWTRLFPRSATHRSPAASRASCPGASSLPSFDPRPPNSASCPHVRPVDGDAVARVRHVDAAAVRRHRDAAQRARAGDRAEVAPVGPEPGDPLVPRVGDVERARRVDRDGRGSEQLSRPRPGDADRAGRRAGGPGEHDQAAAALVDDDRVAGGVEGDGHRIGKDRGPRRRRAPHRDHRPVGRQQLEAAVDRVGDRPDATRVGGHARGGVELPGRAPRGSEAAQERAPGVEDVDAVVAGVRHVHVALGVGGDPARVGELARRGAVGAPPRAVRIPGRAAVADDPVVEVVGDEHPSGRIGRDVVGVAQLARRRARPGPHRRELPAPRCRRRRGGGAGRRRPAGACPRTVRPWGAASVPGGTTDRAGAVEREALDPVVAGVRDEHVPTRDGEAAARARGVPASGPEGEVAQRGAAPAPGGQDAPARRSGRSGWSRPRRAGCRPGRPRRRRPSSAAPGSRPPPRRPGQSSRPPRRPGSCASPGRRRRPSRRARPRPPGGSAGLRRCADRPRPPRCRGSPTWRPGSRRRRPARRARGRRAHRRGRAPGGQDAAPGHLAHGG